VGRGLSIYLDLLRLLALIEVVLFHFAHVGARNPWHVWGREAVVLVFVLSGFVIRHTAQTKDLTIRQFAASRLSWSYSAIIPCLILTMVFDYVGSAMAPGNYSHIDIPSDARTAALKLYSSLFMLDQSWVVKSFYSNAAYWFVSYEFWFYVMFALSFYLKGRRRLLGFAIVSVLAGPPGSAAAAPALAAGHGCLHGTGHEFLQPYCGLAWICSADGCALGICGF
jgi:peptidoglycan/LPS O-acetylase OafA/YrhL